MKTEGLEPHEVLVKNEQVRYEVHGTQQTTRHSERGLVSLLAGND